MAKTETLHIRVNEQVKANAEETLDMLGISISKAVNMFLCQVNLTGGLPFAVKLPAPERIIVRSKSVWKTSSMKLKTISAQDGYQVHMIFSGD